MSKLMADICRLLQIKQILTPVYHPQTDGLVERFNQTLKRMLRRVVDEGERLLPYVLQYLQSEKHHRHPWVLHRLSFFLTVDRVD